MNREDKVIELVETAAKEIGEILTASNLFICEDNYGQSMLVGLEYQDAEGFPSRRTAHIKQSQQKGK